MRFLIPFVCFLACLQSVYLYPIQEDESSFIDNYGMRLAKRPFYAYKDSILSPFGFLENSKEGRQGHRKKAVDSTFIRFGRSSSAESSGRNLRSLDNKMAPSALFEELPADESQQSGSEEPSSDMAEFKLGLPPRYILNHNGCRVTSSQELMKALMTDPNCIRAFQKAKKENVNDTFIRFGKREAPPEKEFEKLNEMR